MRHVVIYRPTGVFKVFASPGGAVAARLSSSNRRRLGLFRRTTASTRRSHQGTTSSPHRGIDWGDEGKVPSEGYGWSRSHVTDLIEMYRRAPDRVGPRVSRRRYEPAGPHHRRYRRCRSAASQRGIAVQSWSTAASRERAPDPYAAQPPRARPMGRTRVRNKDWPVIVNLLDPGVSLSFPAGR